MRSLAGYSRRGSWLESTVLGLLYYRLEKNNTGLRRGNIEGAFKGFRTVKLVNAFYGNFHFIEELLIKSVSLMIHLKITFWTLGF